MCIRDSAHTGIGGIPIPNWTERENLPPFHFHRCQFVNPFPTLLPKTANGELGGEGRDIEKYSGAPGYHGDASFL